MVTKAWLCRLERIPWKIFWKILSGNGEKLHTRSICVQIRIYLDGFSLLNGKESCLCGWNSETIINEKSHIIHIWGCFSCNQQIALDSPEALPPNVNYSVRTEHLNTFHHDIENYLHSRHGQWQWQRQRQSNVCGVISFKSHTAS